MASSSNIGEGSSLMAKHLIFLLGGDSKARRQAHRYLFENGFPSDATDEEKEFIVREIAHAADKAMHLSEHYAFLLYIIAVNPEVVAKLTAQPSPKQPE
jgi:hypothetical protein